MTAVLTNPLSKHAARHASSKLRRHDCDKPFASLACLNDGFAVDQVTSSIEAEHSTFGSV